MVSGGHAAEQRPRPGGLRFPEEPPGNRPLSQALRRYEPPTEGSTLPVGNVDAQLLYQPRRPWPECHAPGTARARQAGATRAVRPRSGRGEARCQAASAASEWERAPRKTRDRRPPPGRSLTGSAGRYFPFGRGRARSRLLRDDARGLKGSRRSQGVVWLVADSIGRPG